MNEILPVGAIAFAEPATTASFAAPAAQTSSFGELVASGLAQAEQKSAAAMDALANYAVGNPVSAHELMISMEQARMSVQLTVEVRNRLLEAYQELSRMQI